MRPCIFFCMILMWLACCDKALAYCCPGDSSNTSSERDLLFDRKSEDQAIDEENSFKEKLKQKLNFFKKMTSSDEEVIHRKAIIEEYQPYEGLIIRKINIDVLDPYGSYIDNARQDTLEKIKSFANKIHTNTRDWVVKRDLPFKEGSPVEPSVIVDCIRQLREKGQYKDAVIGLRRVGASDYVDVYVIVQDRFSWSLTALAGLDRSSLGLKINNFLGLSHSFYSRIYFRYDLNNPIEGKGKYKIHNIIKTPFDLEGYYKVNKFDQRYGFKLSKDFFNTPDKEWAGSFEARWAKNRINDHNITDIIGSKTTAKYNFQDLWLAKAFKLNNLMTRSENLRFVVSGRLYNKKYLQKPSTAEIENPDDIFEVKKAFQDQRFVLGGIGIANKDFYIEDHVFYFGENEFLPKGVNLTLLGGYVFNEISTDRWYSGMLLNYGKHFGNLGYLFTQATFGGFTDFGNKRYEEITVDFKTNYLTRKFNLGKWGLRAFAKYQMTLGYNRIRNDEININNENGLYGIKSERLEGNRTWTLNLETAIYPPFTVMGFESSVFVFGNLGMVGKGQEFGSLVKSRIYQGYGVGIRLRNEKIGLRYIEFAFAYYPKTDFNDAHNYSYWYDQEQFREIRSNNLLNRSGISPAFEDLNDYEYEWD